MAQRYYGNDRGDTEFGITEDSSTTATTDVELRVDLASNITKSEVLIQLDMIKNHILKGNWPPA